MKTLQFCLALLVVFSGMARLAQEAEQPDMAGIMYSTCDFNNDLVLALAGGVVYLHVPQISESADKIKPSGSKVSGEFCMQEGKCRSLEATLDFKRISAKEVSGTYEFKVEGWSTPWTGNFHAYYAKQTQLDCL